MKIHARDFRVPPGDVDLRNWPTRIKPAFNSEEQYQDILESRVAKLDSLQKLHYAQAKFAVLLIFQGMDGAGKDGAIRHVMSGVNPQGCEVFSFKQPSEEELKHDFLWRTTWKFGPADIREREYWKHYMRAYEECLSATSTLHAPWYAVPADDKDTARLIVSQIVIDALSDLKMSYPKSNAKRRQELKAIRRRLTT